MHLFFSCILMDSGLIILLLIILLINLHSYEQWLLLIGM